MPDWRPFVVEAMATLALALVAVSVATGERVPVPVTPVTPVAVGAVLAVTIFAATPLSGGAINPARAFGPNIVFGHVGPLWVYLDAPVIGGCSPPSCAATS